MLNLHFDVLGKLYGAETDAAAQRCQQLAEQFAHLYNKQPTGLFSAPGRTELGGNHTDHQHGCVLAASINRDALAAAAPNGTSVVNLVSEGFSPVQVDLQDLSVHPQEFGTTAGLIRGVAAGFAQLGHSVASAGFDVCIASQVASGSGLSSSAAFEVLMGNVFDHLFFGGNTDPVTVAKIGQFAENTYFGKPCGLMDQIASSVGGAVWIDFADTKDPQVQQLEFDPADWAHTLCFVDCGADHADLTQEYADITQGLSKLCAFFGKEVLRQIPQDEFMANLAELRKTVDDRTVLRAMHIYEDSARACRQAKALQEGDFRSFLKLVNESGRSSALYLQNVTPTGQTQKQDLLFTIALCEKLLDGEGAVRVHGGGFGGLVQAYVPTVMVQEFTRKVNDVLGEGSVTVASLRPLGGIRLA